MTRATMMTTRSPQQSRPRLWAKYAKALRVSASVPLYRFQRDKRRHAEWMRAELERAGALFVKIGQWISTRTDIFPDAVTEAFSGLRKDVSPMSFEDVQRIVTEDGHTIDLVETPVSSGSIAQVHVDAAGRFAVKVQRPGLRESLREDLDIVRAMLLPLRFFGDRKTYDDASKSLTDLGRTIEVETDFELEADHMRAFADFFDRSEWVRVPRVVASSARVIVMEYVPSAPVTDVPASKLIELFLTQFFELGLLHTDLHAGNMGLDDDGRVVLYDFGSVLACSEELRECTKRMFVGYLNRDPGVMLDYLLENGVVRSRDPLTPDQRETLEAFVEAIIEYVENTDVRDFHIAMQRIPVPATMPSVEFVPEVFMVFRTFTLLEGLCKRLDPNFVILNSVVPYATKMLTDPELYRFKAEDDMRTLWKRHDAWTD